ncbi:ubiquitin-protein transferase activating protein, partial [Coelomomyces lativittatus]
MSTTQHFAFEKENVTLNSALTSPSPYLFSPTNATTTINPSSSSHMYHTPSSTSLPYPPHFNAQSHSQLQSQSQSQSHSLPCSSFSPEERLLDSPMEKSFLSPNSPFSTTSSTTSFTSLPSFDHQQQQHYHHLKTLTPRLPTSSSSPSSNGSLFHPPPPSLSFKSPDQYHVHSSPILPHPVSSYFHSQVYASSHSHFHSQTTTTHSRLTPTSASNYEMRFDPPPFIRSRSTLSSFPPLLSPPSQSQSQSQSQSSFQKKIDGKKSTSPSLPLPSSAFRNRNTLSFPHLSSSPGASEKSDDLFSSMHDPIPSMGVRPSTRLFLPSTSPPPVHAFSPASSPLPIFFSSPSHKASEDHPLATFTSPASSSSSLSEKKQCHLSPATASLPSLPWNLITPIHRTSKPSSSSTSSSSADLSLASSTMSIQEERGPSSNATCTSMASSSASSASSIRAFFSSQSTSSCSTTPLSPIPVPKNPVLIFTPPSPLPPPPPMSGSIQNPHPLWMPGTSSFVNTTSTSSTSSTFMGRSSALSTFASHSTLPYPLLSHFYPSKRPSQPTLLGVDRMIPTSSDQDHVKTAQFHLQLSSLHQHDRFTSKNSPTRGMSQPNPHEVMHQETLAHLLGCPRGSRMSTFSHAHAMNPLPMATSSSRSRMSMPPPGLPPSPPRPFYPSAPIKTLEATGLHCDYYLNLLDWSKDDWIGVGLHRSLALYSMTTGQVEVPYVAPARHLITSVVFSKHTSMVWMALHAQGGPPSWVSVDTATLVAQSWTAPTSLSMNLSLFERRIGVMASDPTSRHLYTAGTKAGHLLMMDTRQPQWVTHHVAGAHRYEVCGLAMHPSQAGW